MILTIASLKGGVGKTTLTAYLAQALREKGKRVLVIDADHNGSLTFFYLPTASEGDLEAANVKHALLRKRAFAPVDQGGCIWPTEKGDFVPATISLASVGLEIFQAADHGAVLGFRQALRRLDYDAILLDVHNALVYEMTASLYAADLVLVPVTAMPWTVRGYLDIEREVQKVHDSIGVGPRILAVPSMVSDIEAGALRELDIWQSTKAAIRRDKAIRDAASAGRALREDTIAARAFAELAGEVVG
ncbi:MAG: ParA family protein [Spirochaetaceae bacterium]|nr:ParA family protein [Spirochaetaceae bacterium]